MRAGVLAKLWHPVTSRSMDIRACRSAPPCWEGPSVRGDCGPRCDAAMKGGDIIVEGKLGYQSGFWPAGRIIALGGAGASCADALWDGQVWVLEDIESLGVDTQVVEPEPEEAASVETLPRYGLDDSAHDGASHVQPAPLVLRKSGCKRMADDLTKPIAFHSRRLRRGCQVQRWRHLTGLPAYRLPTIKAAQHAGPRTRLPKCMR